MNEKLLTKIISLGLIFGMSTGAFSFATRQHMLRKANYRSQWSGRSDLPLEASHFNHDKSKAGYDNPHNGVIITQIEHLAFHVFYEGEAHKIGLKEEWNDLAIQSLTQRSLSSMQKCVDPTYTEDDLWADVNTIIKKYKRYITMQVEA